MNTIPLSFAPTVFFLYFF